MRAKNRQTRGRLPWPAVLFLICAWPLISGWSLFRDEGESAAKETKDECLRLAILADEGPLRYESRKETQHGSTFTPANLYNYRAACEGERLRGCLLPPEEHSTVEEYQYRKRNCQEPTEDCAVLQQRISMLQQNRRSLSLSKNSLCRPLPEGKMATVEDGDRCRYGIRRVTAVLDAIAVNEGFFEKHCHD